MKELLNEMFYTMGIMTNVSCYAMIRVSPEERSRYDVPDPADVHIIDRPDADTDLCFVMHARNVCWDQYGNFGSVDK